MIPQSIGTQGARQHNLQLDNKKSTELATCFIR